MSSYKLVSDGSMLMVDPWNPMLSRECTYHRTSYDPFTSEKKKVKEELYHVQHIDGRTVGYVADGLCDRVMRWFNDKSLPFTFENKRYWKELPVPDWGKVDFAELRDGQEEALTVIATNYNGVIDACTGYGKTYLIVQLCRMYPKLNIVLITSRKSVVKTIYDRLMKERCLAGQVGIITSSKNTGPDYRIIVTTTKSMEKVNYETCDLLLFDECHGLAAPGTAYKMAIFRRARKFGLSASPEGRGDTADKVLEGLIGPTRFSLSYQKGVDIGAVVPIDVHMYDVPGARVWHRTRLALKRAGLWQNEVRNKMIADIALSFGEQQVLIMCETVEHVMQLKQYLPEYVAAYATCSKERYEEYTQAGLTKDPILKEEDLTKLQEGFESGKIRHILSTMVFKEGYQRWPYMLVRAYINSFNCWNIFIYKDNQQRRLLIFYILV